MILSIFFFRFLRHFVTKCDEIVSPKLETAKKNAMTSENNFEETLSKISDLEKVWQEVKKHSLQSYIYGKSNSLDYFYTDIMTEKMDKLVSCLTLHERIHLSLSNLFDWSRKYSSTVQLINSLHLLEWFTGLLAIFNYFCPHQLQPKI